MGGQPEGHVVLFPFTAQGHIIPYLALATLIDRRHRGRLTVTLVNTPLNIRNIRASLPPDSTVLLRELPFSAADHGLPPGAENTDSLPYHLMIHLFQATESLRPHFSRLLSDVAADRSPICVIADVFIGWTVEIARELGAYHATFTTCGGYGTAAYFSLWQHLSHRNADSNGEFSVPGFPETFRLHLSQVSKTLIPADGSDPWSTTLRRQISLCLTCDGMLCNTVEAAERSGMELLRKIAAGRRVWAIGPIFPAADGGDRAGRKPGISPEKCAEWLGARAARSVVYVSFGSENTIGPHQMMELAKGLEASSAPFIWVIRPPIGFDLKGEFRDEWLPEGFEEKKQGILVRNWAPQIEILSHESVGAFVSHCGWNSTLESLSRGVPMIGWPTASEQFYNSKMMEEELGVCVELARGGDGDVVSGEVARVIKSVVGGDKGEEMRRRAAVLAETIKAAVRGEGGETGPSIAALDEFLGTALRQQN